MELKNLISNLEVVHAAVEQLQVSIIISDTHERIVFVNEHVLESTGYSKKELLGKHPKLLVKDHDLYQAVKESLYDGKAWKGEYQSIRKDGSLFWVRDTVTPIRDENQVITHFISLKQDISDQKEEEFKIQRRERILNDIQKLSETGGWEYDRETGEFYWTEELFQIHGFEKPYPEDYRIASLKCYRKEDQELVTQTFQECLDEGKPYDLTLPFTDIKGSEKWVRMKGHADKDESGNVLRVIGSLKDITDEIEAEKAQEESELKFRNVIKAFDDVVFTLDMEGRHTEVFGHIAKDEGFRDHFIGKTALEAFGEEKGQIHLEAFERAKKEGSVVYEWENIDKNGDPVYIQTKLNQMFDSEGNVSGILGVGRYMTREVQSRKKAEELQERLDYALKGTQAGTWDWNIITGEIILNERWAEMIGYRLEELQPITFETWEKYLHPVDLIETRQKLNQYISGKSEVYDAKFRMRHKNGHWVWIWDRGAIFETYEDGTPVRMVGTHMDITKQVEAEKKLAHSEKRYRDLFEKSTDPTLIEKNEKIVACNEAAYKMLGFNSKDELIGKKVVDISAPKQFDDRDTAEVLTEVLQKAIDEGSHTFEWEHVDQHGNMIPMDVVLTNIQDVNGEYIRHVVLRDIRDRKEAENKLLASYEERGTLLSEIHHRVKNNLAIISGLMQLQIFNSKSGKELEVLNKSINRIKSIALIHEQLYESKNFTNIELDDNIRKQAENLQSMYESDIAVPVELDLNLKPVKININQALPVGLLVNEILNNSFKHAFKGEDAGIISITLREENEEFVNLSIMDNGVGIPEDEKDKVNNSLGTTLINTFIKQLNAKAVITNNVGTAYHITFKKTQNMGSVINKIPQ